MEGVTEFVKKTLAAEGDAFSEVKPFDEGNPNRHLMMDAFQRRLVHDAMALGRAMKRKVILPRLLCWCDRYWNTLEDCRFPTVSRQQLPLPFHCPFDHLYDIEK